MLNKKSGIKVMKINWLAYADDVVLMANNLKEAEQVMKLQKSSAKTQIVTNA